MVVSNEVQAAEEGPPETPFKEGTASSGVRHHAAVARGSEASSKHGKIRYETNVFRQDASVSPRPSAQLDRWTKVLEADVDEVT